jgi:transcription antitermination factor NusG
MVMHERVFHVDQTAAVAAVNKRWFCLMVAPNEESAVARRLLEEHELEAFAPVCIRRVKSHVQHKWFDKREPMFRSYIFVELRAPVSAFDWNRIQRTKGAIRLLGTTSGPAPMPIGLVEELQAAGEQVINPPGVAHRFKRKELARVTNGPFANFVGVITRAESDKRIHMLIRLFDSAREVVVPVSVLEPVAAKP